MGSVFYSNKIILIPSYHTLYPCLLLISLIHAAAKLLQSCPTLYDPRDSSPPGSPRPWDSPGKNTGVGCHFLLQCMKVKTESEVAQLCPTPSDPMDCSLPGSSIHGICHARVLEWGAIAFSALMHKHIYIYDTYICIHISIYCCYCFLEQIIF